MEQLSEHEVKKLLADAAETGHVPEHEVKKLLTAAGVTVPKGVALPVAQVLDEQEWFLTEAAITAGLKKPVVLKGYGPGLLHKSDVGAVRTGLTLGELSSAAGQMAMGCAAAGVVLAGFLVEQQVAAGVELLVGVVDRPPFGQVAALGLGGTLAEVLDDVVLRLCPISRDDAEAMVAGFRGHELLEGFRGAPACDTEALVALLLAVAGPQGVAARLGGHLAELECNPVIVGPDGAVAADARLILAQSPTEPEAATPPTDFGPLFAPRSIAVAGASSSGGGFGNIFLQAYQELGWGPGSLWAIHPSAESVEGVPAHASVVDIPGEVDYVVAAVPAAACPGLVTQAAGKARFVHIISGGFREVGTEGEALEEELLAATRASGVRVLGPNCLGAYSPAGRQTFQRNAPTAVGNVSMISQSGGLAGDMVKGGAVRGIRFSKLCTLGNSIDVTPGELLEWLVDDPDTSVVGMYLEDPRSGRRLCEALQRAAGVKPVVLLVGGRTGQGGGAAASHTGALVAEQRVWDAVSVSTGTSLVGTLEELLAAVSYLQRYAPADATGKGQAGGEPDTLLLGVGGGASVLGTDAADRAGLVTTPVSAAGQQALRDLGHGVGTSVGNPIEIGFGPISEPDVLVRALDPILASQRYPDVVIHANIQAYFSYGGDGIDRLFPILETTAARGWPGTRLAVVLRNLDCAPAEVTERIRQTCCDVGLPAFVRFDEAMVAVAAAKRHARQQPPR